MKAGTSWAMCWTWLPEVNMEELSGLRQGEGMSGSFLWVIWNTVGRSARKGLWINIAKWGVAGIKVDFMQRSDQKLIEYFH